MGMARAGLRPYRRFLIGLLEEVREAIGEAENAEWHHASASDMRFQHYLRLSTWEAELSERKEHYDNARTKRAWKSVRRSPPAT